MFIQGDIISLLYCIAITKEQGEGQTSDLCYSLQKPYVTADYGWVMSMLCCHKFCVYIQIKLQLLSDSTAICFRS